MARSAAEIRPVITLHQEDGSSVQVAIVDDIIWISDVSSSGECHFTLRVPRGPMDGDDTARTKVQELFRERARKSKKPYGKRSETYVAGMGQVEKAMDAGPPAKAGYWYVDPTFSPMGNPVINIDP